MVGPDPGKSMFGPWLYGSKTDGLAEAISILHNGDSIIINGPWVYQLGAALSFPSTLDGITWIQAIGAVLQVPANSTYSVAMQINIASGHAYSKNSSENGYFHNFQNLYLDGNKANQTTNIVGVKINGDTGAVSASINFINPNIVASYGAGVELVNCNLVWFYGGNVRHNRLWGIYSSNGQANVFVGTNIEANGYGSGAGWAGMAFVSTSIDNKIIGCDFGLNNSNSGTGDSGYQFTDDNTCATNIFVGCKVQSSIAGVITQPYSLSGSNDQVISCTGTNGQAIMQTDTTLAHGFSTTTPAIPASGTAQQNTNPYPVRVYLLTGGTGTAVAITDPSGTTQSITVTLAAGQEWTLDPGASITLTYTVAPTWKWYGV